MNKKELMYQRIEERGYSLKIKDDYVELLEKKGKKIYKDWGGYGILAPDFRD